MTIVSNLVLLPLPVAGPMAAAALLLLLGHFLPKHVPDAIAAAVAAAAGICCLVLASRAAEGPIVGWFGGWVPHDGLALGIAFGADRASATIAALACLLFAASFVFSWGYFNETSAHYHVLMLMFLAAMVGFSLTHDLFNLFVWFEVMSVAAFALTGFKLESQAISGALNFTVTNSIAGYMILAGIGLIYSRAGALDFAVLAGKVAAMPDDRVIAGAFCLVVCGLLIKAAMVPFHFWLADAHAVAPSPVCVIFSGAMVAMGLFGVAKLTSGVFVGSPVVMGVVHHALLGLATVGALVGGFMALSQRHVKRMLAFSTISHSGIMLAGVASVTDGGTAGMLTYVVGHGLIKGALFMVAGILLASRASIDEIALRGQGRHGIWPAGVVMAFGGLVLGGLPFGVTDEGFRLILSGLHDDGYGPVGLALALGAALTGGAVLRAAGRIFLGLGPNPGSEADAPTDAEEEKADRSFGLMIAPTALLALLACCPGSVARHYVEGALGAFAHPQAASYLAGHADPVTPIALHGAGPWFWLPWASIAGALAIALYSLSRDSVPDILRAFMRRTVGPVFHGLERLHSGFINDYVAWIAGGLAIVVAAFGF